jgi:hypothetical protein
MIHQLFHIVAAGAGEILAVATDFRDDVLAFMARQISTVPQVCKSPGNHNPNNSIQGRQGCFSQRQK